MRRRRWVVHTIVAVVVLAGAGIGAFELSQSAPPAPATRYLTVRVARTTVRRQVSATGVFAPEHTYSLTSPKAGMVTSTGLTTGRPIVDGQVVFAVDAQPIYALVTNAAMWRPLSLGETGPDVTALQQMLESTGHLARAPTGSFDTLTAEAVSAFQSAIGVTPTGAVALGSFVVVPPGTVVGAVTTSVGGNVSSGGTVASLVSPSLVLDAQVNQLDLPELAVGQAVTIRPDALASDKLAATLMSLPPATVPTGTSSTSTKASGSAVTFPVTVLVKGTPAHVIPGMTATMSITISERSNVLAVPTSALSGPPGRPFVRVPGPGGTSRLVPVHIGLATASLTEVTKGLSAGEQVIVGTSSSGSSTTSRHTSTSPHGPGAGGLKGVGGHGHGHAP
ncbi:MAG: efflux RND transporter periplasmic adaptor subunit [Acidimicrobiales bacterium]